MKKVVISFVFILIFICSSCYADAFTVKEDRITRQARIIGRVLNVKNGTIDANIHKKFWSDFKHPYKASIGIKLISELHYLENELNEELARCMLLSYKNKRVIKTSKFRTILFKLNQKDLNLSYQIYDRGAGLRHHYNRTNRESWHKRILLKAANHEGMISENAILSLCKAQERVSKRFKILMNPDYYMRD